MPRQRTFNCSGNILDAPSGVDAYSWANDSLLTKKKPQAPPRACQCPPAAKNRLGGCQPGLRWISHSQPEACCNTCLKALRSDRRPGARGA